MKILVDEDLPRAATILLKDLGHECRHVCDVGLRGMPDREIYETAKRCGELVLTADPGFGNPNLYPRGEHHGIVILRFPDYFRRKEILSLIDRFARSVDIGALAGALVVVDPGAYRIRR